MEITFRSRSMAKTFNKEKKLRRKYGSEMASVIRQRLDDLNAAKCLEDLRNAPGDCHELSENLKGVLSLDLRGPYRLLFRPENGNSDITKSDGGLNWEAVNSVKILEVKNTHGK